MQLLHLTLHPGVTDLDERPVTVVAAKVIRVVPLTGDAAPGTGLLLDNGHDLYVTDPYPSVVARLEGTDGARPELPYYPHQQAGVETILKRGAQAPALLVTARSRPVSHTLWSNIGAYEDLPEGWYLVRHDPQGFRLYADQLYLGPFDSAIAAAVEMPSADPGAFHITQVDDLSVPLVRASDPATADDRGMTDPT
ncbi:MAG: hypothetical protein JWM47_2840 [Acidimicrobiales bacterium]|nr:hypothetical protein [Acidimicrobiales bacterium]